MDVRRRPGAMPDAAALLVDQLAATPRAPIEADDIVALPALGQADVAPASRPPSGGTDGQAGVVVEDLGFGAVGRGPAGDVGLPAFVGQVGLEPVAR